jgi:pimeloyl-ACP methyl ester carboxylesterase
VLDGRVGVGGAGPGGRGAGGGGGYAAERRALGGERIVDDPEWEELKRRIEGHPVEVKSFDGTRLHTDVLGDDAAPTIVFAHGYTHAKEFWHYQRRDLPADFRVVCYDQRGHGRSEEAAEGDYSTTALGHDLLAVLDATCDPDRPVLAVGHSMGGMAILAFAEEFPGLVTQRLAGAVLVNTTGSDVLAGTATSAALAALGALRRGVASGTLRLMGRRPTLADRVYGRSTDLSFLLTRAIGFGPNASPAIIAFGEQLLLGSPSSVVAALLPTLSTLDLREAAAHLTVPVVVVAGEKDRLTPMRASHRLGELLPNGWVVVLPQIGHMAPLEDHDRFTRLVREHAQRVFEPES